MKQAKRILVVLIAIMMVMSFAVTAYAQELPTGTQETTSAGATPTSEALVPTEAATSTPEAALPAPEETATPIPEQVASTPETAISVLEEVGTVLESTPETIMQNAAPRSVGGQTVTLRLETLESTKIPTVSVKMPDTYKTFAEYGLTGIADPGYNTPVHALAEYLIQSGQATVATMPQQMTFTSSGFVLTLLGFNGSDGNGVVGCSWEYRVNNQYPSNNVGAGYLFGECPIVNGDDIVIFGSSYPVTKYAYFATANKTATVGEPVDVVIVTSGAKSGAVILKDGVETAVKTDDEGKATLFFDTPGVYALTAVRKEGVISNISRPYCKVTVTTADMAADQALVNSDRDALPALPAAATGSIVIAQRGASGRTVVSWSSDNTAVVANDGTVIRPAPDSGDATVTLTATVTKGKASATRAFTVLVKEFTAEEVFAQIAQIKAAFAGTISVDEKKDANIVVKLQAMADKVVAGSKVTITASENPQIDAVTGDITYGSKQSSKGITIGITLVGQSESCAVTVKVSAHKKTMQEAVDEDAAAITWDKIKNANADRATVKTSLKLPTSGGNYADVKWTTSSEKVVSTYGSVYRPDHGQPDANVTLTCTVSAGAMMEYMEFEGTATPVTKTFEVTVAAYSDAEFEQIKAQVDAAATNAKDAVKYQITYMADKSAVDLTAVKNDLSLSMASAVTGGVDYKWESKNTAIVINAYRGKVMRPAIGQQDASGKLKVVFSKAGYSAVAEFDTMVMALTQKEVDDETAFLNSVKNALTFDVVKKDNPDEMHVYTNLGMVYRGIEQDGMITWKTSNGGEIGAKIEWETSDSGAMGAYEIKRPDVGQADREQKLTATITSQFISTLPVVTKEITINVKAYSNDLAEVKSSSGTTKVDTENATVKVSGIDRALTQIDLTLVKDDPQATIAIAGVTLQDGMHNIPLVGEKTTVTAVVTSNKKAKSYTIELILAGKPLPSLPAEWESFRGDENNNGMTDAQTVGTEAETTSGWSTKLTEAQWGSVGSPLIIDDAIYVAADNMIKKLDKNGNVVKTGTLADSIGFFSYAAYGEGMLYVPISKGRIQALNADTLESMWISSSPGATWQAISPLTYDNGCIYTGMVEYLSSTKTNGLYVCINVTDEDPSLSNEIKELKWSYSNGETLGGYYWSGGVQVGGSIIFGGDNGKLVSAGIADGAVIDTVAVQGMIRSAIVYHGDTAYFTTTKGSVYAVPMQEDGTFGTARSVKLTYDNSTAAPVLYNGRMYVLSGSEDGNKGAVDVIDTASMQTLSSAQLPGYSQSSPLLTTAYATAENGYMVYLYALTNDETGSVLCIEDSAKHAAPEVRVLYRSGNFSAASLVADSAGTLYFTNDSGMLFALSKKAMVPPVVEPPVTESPVVAIDPETGVTLEVDGKTVPKGTKPKVAAIPQMDARYQQAGKALEKVVAQFKLFDIKLYNAEGAEIQPNGKVRIGIPVPVGFDANRLVVYHMAEDGAMTQYAVSVSGSMAYFETDHFSLYVLAERVKDAVPPVNQGDTSGGVQAGVKKNAVTVPRTGDSQDMSLYIILLAIGIAVGSGVLLARRKAAKHG